MLHNLKNISPIDGRYSKLTQELNDYFSESALIKYRIYIELEYFIQLCEMDLDVFKSLTKKDIENIKSIYNNISEKDIERIKEIESITNHDVKAVEYFIKEKFEYFKLHHVKEFIHFGLTSQDINNSATPLLLMNCLDKLFLSNIKRCIK